MSTRYEAPHYAVLLQQRIENMWSLVSQGNVRGDTDQWNRKKGSDNNAKKQIPIKKFLNYKWN
jgi:hypothetical protein